MDIDKSYINVLEFKEKEHEWKDDDSVYPHKFMVGGVPLNKLLSSSNRTSAFNSFIVPAGLVLDSHPLTSIMRGGDSASTNEIREYESSNDSSDSDSDDLLTGGGKEKIISDKTFDEFLKKVSIALPKRMQKTMKR